MKSTIDTLRGRQVWDSRGRPTVEVEVCLSGGAVGRAIAPAGASRGAHEAVDLRDGGAPFGGMGVERSVGAVNGEIAALMRGQDACQQAKLDEALILADGSFDLGRFGANATVAVSLAILDAAAASAGTPRWAYLANGSPCRLPLPAIQVFGGGAHAGRRTDVQDFMIMAPRAGSYRKSLEIAAEVYHAAGRLMEESGRRAGVADEGGWWPMFASNEEALSTLTQSIVRAGHRPGEDVFIALDIAANELHAGGLYSLGLDGESLDAAAMVDRIAEWVGRYPILSVEDPVAQDELEGMAAATRLFGDRVQLIGDDVLVTNAARVERAAAAKAGNAVLIKVNQAGTVTRAKAALDAANAAGWGTIVSARSGETEDVSIAHLAVGWDAGQIKVGSFSRSERMAKWNELLRIEEAMGEDAVFAGDGGLPAAVRSRLS